MRSPAATAPAPSAAARSSAASTSRASAISSSVGVNASRSASSCAGWIAHLPSKPSVRACSAPARKASSSRVPRCGPSIAWMPARAGGDEHALLGEAPVLRRAAAGPPERRREIGVAEDQPVEALRRARDLGRRREPRRGLDQREQPHRRRAAGGGLGAREQPVGEREVVRDARPWGARPSARRGRSPPGRRGRSGTTACRSRSPAPRPTPPPTRRRAPRRRRRARRPWRRARPRPRGRARPRRRRASRPSRASRPAPRERRDRRGGDSWPERVSQASRRYPSNLPSVRSVCHSRLAASLRLAYSSACASRNAW